VLVFGGWSCALPAAFSYAFHGAERAAVVAPATWGSLLRADVDLLAMDCVLVCDVPGLLSLAVAMVARLPAPPSLPPHFPPVYASAPVVREATLMVAAVEAAGAVVAPQPLSLVVGAAGLDAAASPAWRADVARALLSHVHRTSLGQRVDVSGEAGPGDGGAAHLAPPPPLPVTAAVGDTKGLGHLDPRGASSSAVMATPFPSGLAVGTCGWSIDASAEGCVVVLGPASAVSLGPHD
jgi:hypothetical protein